MPDSADLDRNWNELLQELRVTQTGLQILTGFLVTLPFQSRFTKLGDAEVTLYLAVLGVAVSAMVLVMAPVSFHRLLFRQREKDWLVLAGHWCARAGLALSALAVVGVVWLLFGFVVGADAGLVAAIVLALTFVVVWLLVPVLSRRWR